MKNLLFNTAQYHHIDKGSKRIERNLPIYLVTHPGEVNLSNLLPLARKRENVMAMTISTAMAILEKFHSEQANPLEAD